jgi:hypothetical protein
MYYYYYFNKIVFSIYFFLPELYEQWVLGHVLNELKCNATIYVMLSVFKHTTNRKEGFPNNSLTPPFFIYYDYIYLLQK